MEMSAIEIIEKMYEDYKKYVQKDEKIADVRYLIKQLVDNSVLSVNPEKADSFIEFNEDGEAVAVITCSLTDPVKKKIREVLDHSPFRAAEIRIETGKEQTEDDDGIYSEEELLWRLGFRFTSSNRHRYAELELSRFQRATAYLRFYRQLDDC